MMMLYEIIVRSGWRLRGGLRRKEEISFLTVRHG